MFHSKRVLIGGACAALWLACLAGPAGAMVPPGSAIGSAPPDRQRVLLNPMDSGESIHRGAWRMERTYAVPSPAVPPKLGLAALSLGAERAEVPGSKGDFTVAGQVPGRPSAFGMWVYLREGANVARLGFQVQDGEDESLIALVPADWTGWKWVETSLEADNLAQTYPQEDKNGRLDYPVKGVHVAWFTREPGPTQLTVDAVAALTTLDRSPESAADVVVSAPREIEPGQPIRACAFATNFTATPLSVDIDYSLQRDPALYSRPLPDPVYGSNHAVGSRSWLEVDGEVIEDEGSTDGKSWTAPGTAYKQGHYTEAFQYVDLGQVRDVRRMTWLSGDANHSWFVDVAASVDGTNYTAVPGLRNVDHYQKWGLREFPLEAPFRAKLIRFRYHTGGTPQNVIRFPSELGIYDGVADEHLALPVVGPEVAGGRQTITVPARSFASAVLDPSPPLAGGAYLLGVQARGPDVLRLFTQHIFTATREDPMLLTPDSRFGINSSSPSLAPRLGELGVGWVRFENMKWPFFSPEPHLYTFKGDVAPWHVNADEVFGAYRDAGLNVLSYMFLVPVWASQPPEDGEERMRLTHPPRDPSLYGEFCFQVVARYGSRKHPPEVLKTEDKVSGLNLVNYYEMYNEPNLNPSPDATWGGWAAPMDQYYEMMRFGAEAVKQADPDAVVTSAGYAGMTADIVDPLRTYTYADGKHPLDFVDVINVHYYSGLEPPETARTDGNIQATGAFTFPENLRELAQWRDRYAPGLPIWMTETGYDSAGPFGTNEEIQAARLPRVVMLCLACGIDKVFVYREAGSTPSMHAASGVLRNDHSKKPSWYTYATLIRQFRDVAGGAVRLPHPDPNVWLMEWDSGGAPLLTAWTVSGNAPLGLDFGRCTVVDAFGGESARESTADVAVTPYALYIRDIADTAVLDALRSQFRALEAAKAARRTRILGLRKYLFDFGTAEHVAALALEGTKTPFVPVTHTAVWDETKGYGFVTPAMRDDDRRWLGRDKLNRDSSRVTDHTFRFRVEPGRYAFEAKVEPFGDPVEVTVTGPGAEPVTRTATKEEPVVEAALAVAGERGTVDVHVHGGYAHIYWITCVEEAG